MLIRANILYTVLLTPIGSLRVQTPPLPLPISVPFLSRRIYVHNAVGTATGYGLDDQSSIADRGKTFLSTELHPDRLWGPRILLSNGYRTPFPRG
jgi:hypothetical protein